MTTGRAWSEPRVALVTGGAAGIGRAEATALAEVGADVAILAHTDVAGAEETARRCQAAGRRALVVRADVRRAAEVQQAVEDVVRELGRLDILVNNAGLMQSAPATEASLQDWDQMVSVNVQGVLYATRAALPHLIEAAADSPRGVADLVTISSTAGWVARPNTAVYSLTKFGVNAFSEGLRQEVLGKRVRVGVVGPGTVDTEIFSHLAETSREAFERQTAGMVMLRPDDIADAVMFMVTRDRRVAVNHMLVRSAEQTW
jgi:NADP-dependent 3-hydroxy acid dehydrogenase YdfG